MSVSATSEAAAPAQARADGAALTFALVDHSLNSALGHNLTYARRVLTAAAVQGFRVVAGVAETGADQDPCAPSLALFPHDVWANNPAEGRLWHTFAAIDRALHRNSVMGAAQLAAQPEHTVSRPSSSSGRHRLARLTDGLRQDTAVLLSARTIARRFSGELHRFVEQAGLVAGDVVYMPTVLAAELQGLEHLLERSPLARSLRWRAMLRYAPRARSVRTSLAAASRRLSRRSDTDIRFFCDTEQLCALHRAASGAPFDLLPVPVDGDRVARSSHAGPLVVGYFGDARDEKGFHLLPEMIQRVRSRAVPTRPLRFAIQVNMNTAEGDARTRAARAALGQMRGDDLELIEGPLAPHIYDDLFRRADIVLLPYQPGAYAERSSGILMEAIMAGLPCVATRGAWMQSALAAAPANAPAGIVAEANPEALAQAVLQIAEDWPHYAHGAQALGEALRPRYDPAVLVRRVVA